MSRYPGKLIVIEGIDGSGKTTLAQLLTSMMKDNGINVICTKEPGGSQLGKQLRELLQKQPIPICPLAEYLLYAADRAQHISEVVLPALMKGTTVISDRMTDSSLVYQGYGRGIDKTMIATVNQWVMQHITPNLIIYLKIDYQTALERLKKRTSLSVFEQQKSDFTHRLINGFDEIFKDRPNVITVDGTQAPDKIATTVYEKIKSWNF